MRPHKRLTVFNFQLAGAGQKMIKEEVSRYIPVSKLKYYFAVDTKYVLRKLIILFFPFTHSVSKVGESIKKLQLFTIIQ